MCESAPLTVAVRGKGIDTPVKSEELMECEEIIDFETLFTTHVEPREIVIKNLGQFARSIGQIILILHRQSGTGNLVRGAFLPSNSSN